MVNYGFGVNVMLVQERRAISCHISVSGYNMLSYLNENGEEATRSIIEALEKVIIGALEEYGPWGADFCEIDSYKETSKIKYFDFSKENIEDEPLFAEIPTPWLLTIMKDWLIFLVQNSKETYKGV